MEVAKKKSATSRNESTITTGYLIPEKAFHKIQALNSQLQLMRELVQRPGDEAITITARALEETLTQIEQSLTSAINQAHFLSH